MVALLATGAVPPAVASLLAAGALVLTGVVTLEQAYRAISWTTVVLVAGMIPLSTAMTVSGAAEKLADRLVDVVGDAGAYPLLIGLFVLTAVLGQLISNTATTLIVIPIALSAAAELDVSVAPGADVAQRGRLGRPAHAGRHAGEHDGDGSGRLPLRRLRQARAAAARVVLRRRRRPRAADLAVLIRHPPPCRIPTIGPQVSAPRRDRPSSPTPG